MKENHLKYLKEKGAFTLRLKVNILFPEEKIIVEKWGHWFQALTDGTLKPFTKMQENLVKVGRHQKKPISIEETAWFKYTKRIDIEKNPNITDLKYSYEENGFYTRKMAKKMKSMMYSETNKNHKA